ncbi:MAG TPA: class I SAM-dependent methyltransferase [Tepidisphaeraceae bacterium]|nr:class I SAM-dependent methyltransferase [Tepidisphaeraceae bacterium]
MTNEWQSAEHALAYLRRADAIPHRADGEETLLAELPPDCRRILDLGAGDGRLLALCLLARPQATGVAADFSPPMLDKLIARFGGDERVQVLRHDLALPLPPSLGTFDAVVSAFAIHHLDHARKRSLYGEVFALLTPGGVFANLEHVASASERLHARFYEALGLSLADEDASNQLLDVETQLRWLREIGYDDVDCYWKWRELALLIGKRPA